MDRVYIAEYFTSSDEFEVLGVYENLWNLKRDYEEYLNDKKFRIEVRAKNVRYFIDEMGEF